MDEIFIILGRIIVDIAKLIQRAFALLLSKDGALLELKKENADLKVQLADALANDKADAESIRIAQEEAAAAKLVIADDAAKLKELNDEKAGIADAATGLSAYLDAPVSEPSAPGPSPVVEEVPVVEAPAVDAPAA
jgi:hypothetical protein